jgi:dipeptidyl aminopeptidase/acylaminoacyl peptidase
LHSAGTIKDLNLPGGVPNNQPWIARNSTDSRTTSPLLYLNQVSTPILFLNGADDRTTPPSQGLEMFTALPQRGIRSEYVVYPREGHAVGQPAHQLDRMQRILLWLAQSAVAPVAPP